MPEGDLRHAERLGTVPLGVEWGRKAAGRPEGTGFGGVGAEEDLVAGASIPEGHGQQEEIGVPPPEEVYGMLDRRALAGDFQAEGPGAMDHPPLGFALGEGQRPMAGGDGLETFSP